MTDERPCGWALSRRGVFALGFALSLGCAPRKQRDRSVVPAAASRATEVTPVFAWRVGLQARVEQTRRLSQGAAGKQKTKENTGSFTLSVHEADEGLAVRFSGLRAEAEPEVIDLLREHVPESLFELRVKADGTYVRTIGADATLAGIASMAENVEPKLAKILTGMDAEFMQSFSGREWDWLVGYWNDRRLPLRGEVTTSLTLAGDTVPVEARFTSNGPLACHAHDERKRCIHVTMTSARTGDACLEDARAKMFLYGVAAAGPGMDVRFRRCAIESETLSEIDSLLPHAQRELTTLEMDISRGGAAPVPFSMVREVTRTMHYDPSR